MSEARGRHSVERLNGRSEQLWEDDDRTVSHGPSRLASCLPGNLPTMGSGGVMDAKPRAARPGLQGEVASHTQGTAVHPRGAGCVPGNRLHGSICRNYTNGLRSVLFYF